MTKEQLAKLGINIEEETITDDEAFKLIEAQQKSLQGDIKKHKDLLSTRNSEIAEYKRKEQEKLSEEEKQKLHYADMEKEIASLKKENALNKEIKDLIGLGYDEELAKKYAEAKLEGKSTIEFQKQFLEAKLEAQKQELLKGGKVPNVNAPDGSIKSKEEIIKGGYEAMAKLQAENPALFEQYFGKSE